MEEKELLSHMGFSDAELRAYLKKLDSFFENLSPAEKRVFLASMPATEDALESFHGEVTAAELEAFLKARTPTSATAVFIVQGAHPYQDSHKPKK